MRCAFSATVVRTERLQRSYFGPSVNVAQGRMTRRSPFGSKMDLRELIQSKKSALLLGGAGAALLGFGLCYKYLRKPEKLVRVGVVSKLLIHPLKSGKALSVALAECQKFGLKYGELQDRWAFDVWPTRSHLKRHNLLEKNRIQGACAPYVTFL